MLFYFHYLIEVVVVSHVDMCAGKTAMAKMLPKQSLRVPYYDLRLHDASLEYRDELALHLPLAASSQKQLGDPWRRDPSDARSPFHLEMILWHVDLSVNA